MTLSDLRAIIMQRRYGLEKTPTIHKIRVVMVRAGLMLMSIFTPSGSSSASAEPAKADITFVDVESKPFVHCSLGSQGSICRPSSGSFVWCEKREDTNKLEEKISKESGHKYIMSLIDLGAMKCGITEFVTMNGAFFPEKTREGILHPQVSRKLFSDLGPQGSYESTSSTSSDVASDQTQPSKQASSTNLSCTKFDESQVITLKGYVVEYEVDEEVLAPATSMALRLDIPICYSKSPDEIIDTIDIDIVSRKNVGWHITAQAQLVAGDGWYAKLNDIIPDALNNQNRVVWKNVDLGQYINLKSIRDEKELGTRSVTLLQSYESISSAMMFGLSEMETVLFDCNRSRYRELQSKWFESKMATGRITKDTGPGPWGPIPIFAIQAFAKVCSP